MSKRPRMEENAASGSDQVSSTTAEAEAGGGSAGAGAPIFAPGRPLKLVNTHTKTFTKKFYFKIYANDWLRDANANRTLITHFGTIIPYHALCMYISPQEYMEVVRGSHFAKVDSASLELKFKAIRTPFDANTTDAAEANGNLQFEIQRWDGLEHMLPFFTVDLEGRGSDVATGRTSYAELITRLYGQSAFCNPKDGFKWPATMRERGLSWRPRWSFENRPTNKTAPGDGMYREINQYISSLPVGEYITDSMNTNVAKMSEGYCFNKTYKPQNGLISMASSAVNTRYAELGKTRVNTKIRFRDTMSSTNAPSAGSSQYTSLFGHNTSSFEVMDMEYAGALQSRASIDIKPQGGGAGTFNQAPLQAPGQLLSELTFLNRNPTATGGVFYPPNSTIQPKMAAAANEDDNNDSYGYGYNNQMEYYTTANLENYTFFNPSLDPPIKHMPSMIIGIVPKTNSDDTIVKATAEFECTTSITISCEDTHPTYMQCAYGGGYDGYPLGYIDNFFTDQRLFGGRWQHNEKEVSLRDDKYWAGDYGLAGKPMFRDYPLIKPLF